MYTGWVYTGWVYIGGGVYGVGVYGVGVHRGVCIRGGCIRGGCVYGVGVHRGVCMRGGCKYVVILLLKCYYPFPRLTPKYCIFCIIVSFGSEVRNVFFAGLISYSVFPYYIMPDHESWRVPIIREISEMKFGEMVIPNFTKEELESIKEFA